MRKLKDFAVNAGLVVASLLVFALFCEFILFRFIMLPSDVPANAFSNGLVRYQPHQTGIWRVRDEIAARFAINAQGWNSGVGDYVLARKPGVARIAVVGDSMIEAMQVPHTRSIGEQLAAKLAREGRPVEAYRFAMSGAPLSQYLHMIEREVVQYRPDWVVVVLIHNDFNESFQFVPGRYTSNFLKLKIADGRVAEEISPAPWTPRIADYLRHTATVRAMYYRWQVRPGAIRDLVIPAARAAGSPYQANIDVATVLRQMPDIAAATDHVFGRMAALARVNKTRLMLVMDGDRNAAYTNAMSDALKLNSLAAQLAGKHGIRFVDLQPVFAADWAKHGRRFEYVSDAHWNVYGHTVAASAVAQAIDEGG